MHYKFTVGHWLGLKADCGTARAQTYQMLQDLTIAHLWGELSATLYNRLSSRRVGFKRPFTHLRSAAQDAVGRPRNDVRYSPRFVLIKDNTLDRRPGHAHYLPANRV